jgi:hypothetical protein
MFQRTKQRLGALMAFVDDILADDPLLQTPPHPHARTVSLRPPRRAGAATPREMHCLCPIRPAAGHERRDRVAR